MVDKKFEREQKDNGAGDKGLLAHWNTACGTSGFLSPSANQQRLK